MKKNTEIPERISEILEFLNLSPNAFAKGIGYTRSQTVYDILNGKSAPSFDFFNRFVNSEYSAPFNLEWVIAGIGEKLKKKENTNTEPQLQVNEPISEHQKECLLCREKEKRIEDLQNQVNHLMMLVNKLTSPQDGEQKRKAG